MIDKKTTNVFDIKIIDILDFGRIFYLLKSIILNSAFMIYVYIIVIRKLMTENLNLLLFRKKNKLNVYYTQNKI